MPKAKEKIVKEKEVKEEEVKEKEISNDVPGYEIPKEHQKAISFEKSLYSVKLPIDKVYKGAIIKEPQVIDLPPREIGGKLYPRIISGQLGLVMEFTQKDDVKVSEVRGTTAEQLQGIYNESVKSGFAKSKLYIQTDGKDFLNPALEFHSTEAGLKIK